MSDLSKSPARVALLIDGENMSATFAGKLISESRKHGQIMAKRVYNDVRNCGWHETNGFRLIHSGSGSRTGKNAADMLLAIEAVALWHEGKADTFVIASSDGDFSHLVQYLCEAGAQVVGVGEEKSTEHLRRSCSAFVQVEMQSTTGAPQLGKIDAALRTIIEQQGDRNAMLISKLNPPMHRLGFRISEQHEKTWHAYLSARDHLYRCDPRGKDAKVYLKT